MSGPLETIREASHVERSEQFSSDPHLFLALSCDQPAAMGSTRHSLARVNEVSVVRGAQWGFRREPLAAGGIQLFLELDDPRVSSQHARIRRDGAQWLLEDAGSTNGTRLNGERISNAALSDGDLIQVGRTFLRFRASLPTPRQTLEDERSRPQGSPALSTVLPTLAEELAGLQRLAKAMVPILLLGDTGTGKELLARAIHQLSGRTGDFVPVNCGALPPTLLESLLFGHVKGAFSGANQDAPGFFRAAHKGTLFLDEVGDLPKPSQAAFLRALQEGEVTPVGATRPVKVEVRVISATHRPLDALVAQEHFRSDLLARLSGARHRLWSLSERREDLGLLVAALLERANPDVPRIRAISPEAGRALLRYGWPLNVRELEQALSAGAVLSEDGVLQLSHLPQSIQSGFNGAPGKSAPTPAPAAVGRRTGDDATLRADLVTRMTEHKGNISEVAREMGCARMQIHRWLRRFNLDPESFRA